MSRILDRLPKLNERKPKINFKFPVFCINCNNQLINDGDFSEALKVCRKCLAVYSRIDDAITKHAEQKTQKLIWGGK